MAEIVFGQTVIPYTVIRSRRKTLGIAVSPDCRVTVKAPADVTDEQIENKVAKRVSWIVKQQRYFQSFDEKIPPRHYVSGESHLYLGRQYILRVTEGWPDSIQFKGRSFEIVCSKKTRAGLLMKAWYKVRAKTIFAEIAEPIIQRFKKYGVEPAGFTIQQMANRWGSCTPKGKIILNTALIKAPKPCIEYVIVHELCHLIHRNHTKAFFTLLAREMPDWERWKKRLDTCCVKTNI